MTATATAPRQAREVAKSTATDSLAAAEERIAELMERWRAETDPVKGMRIEKELSRFVFGS